MTLIIELHNKDANESIFLSDCLVTESGATQRDNNFALHHASGQIIDTYGCAMVSKMASKEGRFIFGAGRLDILTNIFDEYLLRPEYDIVQFQGFLDTLYLDHPKEECLIYGDCNSQLAPSEQFLTTDSYCRRYEKEHFKISVGGSGTEYLDKILQDFQPTKGAPTISWAYSLLAMLIRSEFAEYGFGNYRIGGGYEVFLGTKLGLKRIPYSILDFSTDAKLADDGVYDLIGLCPERAIFSLPEEDCTHFIVFPFDGSKGGPTVFTAKAYNAPLDSTTEVGLKWYCQKIEEFHPEFDILLVRHLDVNWQVAKNCIKIFRHGHNEIRYELDFKAIYEAFGAKPLPQNMQTNS